MNKYNTYLLLGKILALDRIPSHREHILRQIHQEEILWQRFVGLADQHLVLQTLYPKIRDHGLLEYFPEELTDHLKYIFDLTSERNLEVIRQTERITAVITSAGIIPLYMKGVGNILDGLYKYPGERILHDIDILVPEVHFEKASEILLKDGYKSNYKYNAEKKRLIKHYPILFKSGEPMYVELHRSPVNSRYEKFFNAEIAFKLAKHPANSRNCFVMCDEHKIIHNFIHAQLDHNGHTYAREFMRNLYDMFLLADREDPENVFHDFGHYRRIASGYLDVCYGTFGDTPSHRKNPKLFLHTFRFRYFLNIHNRLAGVISLFLIRFCLGYIIKPIRALTDYELRLELLRKIKDPQWYKKQRHYYSRIFGIVRNS